MENKYTLQVGVKILLQNTKGQYLLLRRSLEKYPQIRGRWDIVGGRIDLGFDLLDNLAREVTEETGLNIHGTPQLVTAQDIIIPDTKKHIVRLTYVGQISDGEVRLDGTEHDIYQWFTKEEILNLDDLDMYFKSILHLKLLWK